MGVCTEPLEDRVESWLAAPYVGWWVFEGLVFPFTRRPLAASWPELVAEADRLLRTWNPRVRIVDRPEGRVDWERTLALGPPAYPREYVTTTSGVGLRDDERTALLGWAGWLLSLWVAWCKRVELPASQCSQSEVLVAWLGSQAGQVQRQPDDTMLTRWAFVARRSRWPLLREVVAPTLWAALHPEQEVDRVPLPGTRDVLFQLYAAVCVARVLRPSPRALRWLHRAEEASPGGRIDDGDLSLEYEVWLPEASVARAPLFPPAAIAGLSRHGVAIPRRVDVLLSLRDPTSRFQAILIEVKSGLRSPDECIFQLLAYRQALAERYPGRVLVWGMGESIAWRCREEMLDGLAHAAAGADDVWVFSTPEEAGRILGALMNGQV